MVWTIEQAQKANELVDALVAGIETQQEVLDGLRDSLNAYSEFLTEQIKELRDDTK